MKRSSANLGIQKLLAIQKTVQLEMQLFQQIELLLGLDLH